MDQVIYLYIFMIAILIAIYINMVEQKYNNIAADSLFRKIVLISIAMLVVDIGHEYLSGISGTWNMWLMNILSFLVFVLPSFVMISWFKYSFLLIKGELPKKSRTNYLILIPIVVHIVISFLSIFFPLYFYVDVNNIYHRGDLYFLSIILQYFYLVLPIIMVVINRNKLRDDKFFPLVFFTIIPITGGIIQGFYYGLLIILPLVAFSIFVAYIFIQSKLIAIDYLTNLMNKGAFENYINNIKFFDKKKRVLSVSIFDLDGLKNINDNFGHLTGDKILREFSNQLIACFDRNDFIARIGGDEFVVVKYIENINVLDSSLERLENAFEHLNQGTAFPFPINYSFGCNVFKEGKHHSVQELIEEVDRIMYENKGKKTNTRTN